MKRNRTFELAGRQLFALDPEGAPASTGSGRKQTDRRMTSHGAHVGVHDHGFNTIF